MTNCYKDICEYLNIGYWSVDFEKNLISFDEYIQRTLDLPADLSVSDFLDLMSLKERGHISSLLCRYQDSQIFNVLITLDVRGKIFKLEALLNTVIMSLNKVTGGQGFIKIQTDSKSQSRTIDKATIQNKYKQQLLKAEEKAELAIAERNLALDNLNTALVYIHRDFVVQWGSLKTMKKILGENAYATGVACYKSTFNRDVPCDDCPIVRLFESKVPEIHRIQRSGEILEVMANPVFNDNHDLIGGVLKIDKITDRVKQENTINRLNTLMDAILSNLPVFLFVKNPNDHFKYIYWNKAIAEMTGIPSFEVIGHTDEEIFSHIEDAKRFQHNDADLLDAGGKIYVVEEYTSKDGEHRVVSSMKTLIPSSTEELPWILGISWDITDLKNGEKELIRAKERAEESNRLKSAFLANMSHEIRTPLNAIVGFSDLLSETEDKADRQEYADIIKRNNELLLQLISDILDLSKIEAQSLEFVYEVIDAYELVNYIVASSNLREDAKVPVIFDHHISKCFLYTDRNRVNQVLSNLINNAIKFTPTGDIKVGYHIIENNQIRFYVQDTGTGIEASQLEAIFERFVKLDSFKQGTGLGLPICKSIIEELGGTIGVDSIPGIGSCFWFTLPYEKGIENDLDKAKDALFGGNRVLAKIRIKEYNEGRPTILVAEDIDSNYRLVNSILKSDYNLIRAHNGKEAIALYEEKRPDMILMDIKMPEMDGLQATQIIRGKDENIPIIALSAYAYDSDVSKAKSAGCDDFINKPVSANILQETISNYIN